MIERLAMLWPEVSLFITTCVVMVLGLSKNYAVRKSTAWIAGLGIAVSGFLAFRSADAVNTALSEGRTVGQTLVPYLMPYAKMMIAAVGGLLLMLMAGTVDRGEEADIASGKRSFDPLRSNRAEFYSFFLFSLTGLMLCASADTLIWLFLALELTSLPTYIMVGISTSRNRGREAAVKYFFLGALGAAVFLYAFALIYGATGSTHLNAIAASFQTNGINALGLIGILLALLGFGFKIAAVPMHFYTADVYEGGASQVSAFLAFVPKTAGFLAIILLCSTFGWNYLPSATGIHLPSFNGAPIQAVSDGTQLPEAVRLMLWVIAAMTMTVGNVLAVLQTSIKRTLAYSSIAHSGYMLVGIIAGPGQDFAHDGLATVLFYLFSYGVMNAGTFAVIASLERAPLKGDSEAREVDQFSDLRGLWKSRPVLASCMTVCSLSLLGLPPLLGFMGKLPLFTSIISKGDITLALVLGINSAIAAYYYLKLAFTPLLDPVDTNAEPVLATPFRSRPMVAGVSAVLMVVLAVVASPIMAQAFHASRLKSPVVKPAALNPEQETAVHSPAVSLKAE